LLPLFPLRRSQNGGSPAAATRKSRGSRAQKTVTVYVGETDRNFANPVVKRRRRSSQKALKLKVLLP